MISTYRNDFFASAASPTVITNSTTNITTSSATLNGFLSNDGGENCSVWFEWGETVSYGNTEYPYSLDFTKILIDSSVNQIYDTFTIDLDEDNDLDIVASVKGDNDVVWYDNDGSMSFTKTSIDTSCNSYDVHVIDLDEDGDYDVISSDWGGHVYWYDNDGSESFTKKTVTNERSYGIYPFDYDDDGDIDIIHSNDDYSEIIVSSNNGAEVFGSYELCDYSSYPSFYDRARRMDVGDIDGDGDLDIVCTDVRFSPSYRGAIVWLENDGSVSGWDRHEVYGFSTYLTGVEFVECVDLDDDGDVDVLATDTTFYDDVYFFENDGSGVFSKNTVDSYLSGAMGVCSGDIDDDGDLDVIASGHSADDVKYYLNDGSETFSEHTIDSSLNGAYRVECVDLDLDGDLDVIASGDAAFDLVWYENTLKKGNGTEFNYSLTGLSSGTTYHYRSVANNSDGESYGSDMTFTTSMEPESSENGTAYMTLSSDNQSSSYYSVNRTLSDTDPYTEYNNFSFNPLLDYNDNVTLIVPVSNETIGIVSVTNNSGGTTASSVSSYDSLTNNTYWYNSANYLVYIRTTNVTTSTIVNWSIRSGEEYIFYLEIPSYLEVGDYFMSRGLITNTSADPASGIIAKTYLYSSGGSIAFGPVQWYCSDGNYQTTFSTNTLNPGVYDVDIVFEETSTGNEYHKGDTLYLSTDPPSGVHVSSDLYFSFYDADKGTGLNSESFKIYVSEDTSIDSTDRIYRDRYDTYTGATLYYRVDDYFDNQIYPSSGDYETISISSVEQSEDVPIDWHSFSVKNMNHSIVYFKMTNGSRTYDQYLYPYEPFYWNVLDGEYTINLTYSDTITESVLSYHEENITINNDSYYWIEGYDLNDIFVPVNNLNSTSELMFNFYDSNKGIGLEKDLLKVYYIDTLPQTPIGGITESIIKESNRMYGNMYRGDVGDTIYYAVADYFDNQVFPSGQYQTLSVTDTEQYEDVPVEWQKFSIKNMNNSIVYVNLTANHTTTYYFDDYNISDTNAANPNHGTNHILFDCAELTADEYITLNSSTLINSEEELYKPDIRSVKVRFFVQDGMLSNTATFTPEFVSGDGTSQQINGNGNQVWSEWFDITEETNAPSEWSWSDLESLKINVTADSGNGGYYLLYTSELRVIHSGRREYSQFLYPYEPIELDTFNGDYLLNLTFYDSSYSQPDPSYITSYQDVWLDIDSDTYYWIQGYDLQDIIIEINAVNTSLGNLTVNVSTAVDITNSSVDSITTNIISNLSLTESNLTTLINSYSSNYTIIESYVEHLNNTIWTNFTSIKSTIDTVNNKISIDLEMLNSAITYFNNSIWQNLTNINTTIDYFNNTITSDISFMNSTITYFNNSISSNITFVNSTVDSLSNHLVQLWNDQNSSFMNLENRSTVVFNFYNTNEGLGLDRETLKVFVNGSRLTGNLYYCDNETDTINVTIKDYYNTTLFHQNFTISEDYRFLDLGITFHSWLFGNKNEEYYMISLRKENGSRWWERGIVPGGEQEYLIPSGNYSMRIYDADYNEIYNTSDHGGNISVVNSRVYVIEGSNLSEVISGQSVIQGQLLELSDSLDYALTPDATYYSYNPTVVFSVWDKKGMLLGNDIWSICPPLHVVATTYNEQYAGNTTLSLLAPGNGTRNGTITIENDIVYFSGTADYVNISYTNGTLIQNTSYVPNRVTLSGGDIMINASNNISIFRETVYGQVTKFDWNVYNSSTNPGHIQGRAGYHQAGIEINNPLDVPIYDVYAFAAFTDKTYPDVNTVRVYDVENGAVLESGDGYKTTEDGIDFKITGGLSAGSERGYTLSYYSDQTTTSTYKDVMLHARSYQEDKPFNDEYYNYAEVRWSNTGSETFLGGFRVKLDFNMDVDKDSVIVEDLDNSQLVDSGDYIVGDEFLWIGNNAIGSISPGGTRGFGFYFQEELYPGQNTKELHLNTEIFSFLGLSWTPFLIIFLLSCIPIGLGAVWIVRKGRIKTGYLAPIVLGVFIMLIFYILQAKGV
jgi:hypothetical protein